MKRFRTPQEKKLLSLENDGRNLVAESQWGARDAVAKRKKWVNQSYRKAIHDQLVAAKAGRDPEAVESAVAATKRHGWRKIPDIALGKVLQLKRSGQRLSKFTGRKA